MKTVFVRALALLILSLMLIMTAACSNPADDTENETTTAQSAQTPVDEPESTTATSDYTSDDISSDINYGGKTINILYWSDREHEEFISDSLTGDLFLDALYERNLAVQQRLGVELNFIGEKGNASNTNAFVKAVNNSVTTNESAYHIAAAHSMTEGAVASKGLLLNLNDYGGINFEKPWWPEGLINQATINNKLYFASGDISANMIYMMYVAFYNKDMINDYGLEDPNELVKNNQWTNEKMFEMCAGIYEDMNGDGIRSLGDKFGQYAYTLHLDAFMEGSGISIVDSDGENISINPDFAGEKNINLIDTLNSFFTGENGFIIEKNETVHQYFRDGKSLFWVDRCRQAPRSFASVELSYGILPIPKYNAEQADFRTVIGNPFTLYGIPKDINDEDAEMVSYILECMGSESYRTVSPALFETAMKYKYSTDDISAQMYDIAKSTVIFDIGRVFSDSLSDPAATWEKAVISNQWKSNTKALSKIWDKGIKSLLSIFQ